MSKYDFRNKAVKAWIDAEYHAPIELIQDDPLAHLTQRILDETDEVIYQTVLNTGVNVDKDELVKALQYDREQYEKGFQDGYRHGESDARIHAHWLVRETSGEWGYENEFKWECSNCGCPYTSNNHNYCSQCGAWMEVFKVD